MTNLGLARKAVIVTGAAGGLGLAFAKGFFAAGAYVAIADINEAGARAAAKALDASEKQCFGLAVDITDEQSVRRSADRTREAFGSVDILVNNAALYGTLQRKPFYEITAEEWDRVLSVNLKGAFLCAKAVFPAHARARRKNRQHRLSQRLERIAVVAALRFLEGRYDRDDARHGARTWRLRRDGERCRAGLHPDRGEPYPVADNAETWGVDRGAIRRAEQPEDLVGAVLWLASPHSDFVTGQTLIVDGGRQFG